MSIPEDPNKPLIYNLFGDIENYKSLVLSENDIADFLITVVSSATSLPNTLISELKKGGTLLFLGFGIRHWYLRVLLKIFLRGLELYLKGSKIAAEYLSNFDEKDLKKTLHFYKRGVRIIVNDSEILLLLNELKKRYVEKGGVLKNK